MTKMANDRLETKLAEALAAKKLVVARAVSADDLARAQARVGPLPPDYVRVMTTFGALADPDDDDDYDFNGWAGTLHRLLGPDEAAALTERMRASFGSSGRHAAKVMETFFFMHWEETNAYLGLDTAGQVRLLRTYRPGTIVRALYPSLERCMVDKLGELEPARDAKGASSETTHLEAYRPEDLEGVGALAALEKIEIYCDVSSAVLVALAELPHLREIVFGQLEVDLPDALFESESLERIELRAPAMARRYSDGLNGVLKWMRESAVPAAKRPLYVRLLADDEAWLRAHATDADLLTALDAPNERVVETALRALHDRLPSPKTLEDAEIAILGRTSTRVATLSEQLGQAGATVVRAPTKATTFVIVGAAPRGAWSKAQKLGVPLTHESHVRRLLDARGVRHLAKDAAVVAPRIEEMLLSPDPAAIGLAVTMMESGGVPDGVLEAIVFAVESPTVPKKSRDALHSLATEKLPTFPKILREVLAKTNLFRAGASKLADRLAALDEKSGGAISGRRLARILAVRTTRDPDWGAPTALYALETGDDAFAAEHLGGFVRDGALSLAGLEARLGVALDRAPGALSRLGISKLNLSVNQLKKLPLGVPRMTGLRELVLEHNDLSALPDELAALGALEALDLTSNRFTKLPEVVTKLVTLRRLGLGQHESKPSLRALPESIAALTKLENVDLYGQSFDVAPEVLLRLPSLRAVDLERARAKDEAALGRLVRALEARGVTVTR